MTDATNTARTTSTNTAPWPQRFGTLKAVQVKNGRKGRYAIATVDCSKFEQTAFAFGDKLVDQLIAAGAGAKVWFKGPIEPVERTNADGRTYTEDQMKIVYFKNNSAADSSDAEGSEEGEQAEEGADAPTGETAPETAEPTAEAAAPAPKARRGRKKAAEAQAAPSVEDDEIPF